MSSLLAVTHCLQSLSAIGFWYHNQHRQYQLFYLECR